VKGKAVLGFIIRRTLMAILVVILTSMITFALFFLGPSNPAQPICDQAGGRCTPVKLAAIEHAMGLDRGVVVNYKEFIGGLFHDRTVQMGGEYHCDAPCLGISFGTRSEVTDQLVQKYPATLMLAIGGASIFLVTGVTIGSLAAKWRGSAADRLLVSSTLVLSSVPYYLFALLAWIFLTLKWSIFPETGYFPITEDPIKTFSGLLLPWLVLGLTFSTQYARYTRGQMVETMGEDYIRTATAKGVRSNKVIFRHALRAAIVPVITIFGLDFAALLAGTVFTEVIFEIDGIGRWGLDAIQSPQDFPVITATVLVVAVTVVIGNLLVDILYGFLDPRVTVA
jgi:peptide/nickel transport system permease protein